MAKPIQTVQVVKGERKLQINKSDLETLKADGWKLPEPPKPKGKPEGGKPEEE